MGKCDRLSFFLFCAPPSGFSQSVSLDLNPVNDIDRICDAIVPYPTGFAETQDPFALPAVNGPDGMIHQLVVYVDNDYLVREIRFESRIEQEKPDTSSCGALGGVGERESLPHRPGRTLIDPSRHDDLGLIPDWLSFGFPLNAVSGGFLLFLREFC